MKIGKSEKKHFCFYDHYLAGLKETTEESLTHEGGSKKLKMYLLFSKGQPNSEFEGPEGLG